MVKSLHELKRYLKASLKHLTSANALSIIKKVIRVEAQSHRSIPEKEWAFTDILPIYNGITFRRKSAEIPWLKARIIHQVNKGERLAMEDINKQVKKAHDRGEFHSKFYDQVSTLLEHGVIALATLKTIKSNPVVYGGSDERIHVLALENVQNIIENDIELVDYSIHQISKP